MSDTANALTGLFVAGAVSLTVVLAAFATALVVAQRRRLALQTDYGRRIASAHEEERAALARELHDDVLQSVAHIRHSVEELQLRRGTFLEQDVLRELRSVNADLLELGVGLRAVAQRLHPTIVDHLGLAGALESLAGEAGRAAGLRVTVRTPDQPLELDPKVAHAAYRIVQEALRNVTRHAGVQDAEVEVSQEPQTVVVRIRDQGAGFRAEIANGRYGLGLHSMRERAETAGGTLRVLSRPGHGTTVEATLPRALA